LGYYGQDFSSNRRKIKEKKKGNLRIPRQMVRNIMKQKLKHGTLKHGKTLLKLDYNNSYPDEIVACFQDGTKAKFDLLVGADGIKSRTLDEYYKLIEEPRPPLSYLKIFLVLGISPYIHPLTTERGFYTLDGTSRLFTMPFWGNYCMWQLSFRVEDEEEAVKLKNASSSFKKQQVLLRVKGWHEPIEDLIQSTPLDTIWGTALMDKIPQPLHYKTKSNACFTNKPFLPIVLLGDAMHPMSPFKGQGANQALKDGPLLASWLCKSVLSTALKNYERVMCAKCTPKVLASRYAAEFLHSPSVLQSNKKDIQFVGYKDGDFMNYLKILEEKNIKAELGSKLDDAVNAAILNEESFK